MCLRTTAKPHRKQVEHVFLVRTRHRILSQEQDIAQQRWLLLAGGGFGTAGGEDDLALVEVGVRCSLEQVRTTLGVCICTGTNLELAQCICVSQAPANIKSSVATCLSFS